MSWGRGVGEGRGEEWVQRRTAVGEGVAKSRITVADSSQYQTQNACKDGLERGDADTHRITVKMHTAKFQKQECCHNDLSSRKHEKKCNNSEGVRQHMH